MTEPIPLLALVLVGLTVVFLFTRPWTPGKFLFFCFIWWWTLAILARAFDDMSLQVFRANQWDRGLIAYFGGIGVYSAIWLFCSKYKRRTGRDAGPEEDASEVEQSQQ